MAYNQIGVINTPDHLKRAAEYAANPKKTSRQVLEREGEDALRRVTGYAANSEKTVDAEISYVSGINCFSKTAAKKMAATKQKYGKTDGRLGYHLIQSFAPGEVTPELAHEIGVKYAEAWLGDFEVVVGTHLDRGHIHNHIVVNSVSCVDGHKFWMSNTDFYTKLYGISNDLCRQYGLSVIENIDSRQMTYAEWLRRYGRGGRSLGEIIHADIESCAIQSRSMGELFARMENMGYEVDVSGKHAKVRPLERDRFWRLSTLGFTDDVLRGLMEGRTYTSGHARIKKTYRARGPRRQAHRLTRIEAMYVRWLYVLGRIPARRHPGARRVPLDAMQKFERYRQQLGYIAANRIGSTRDAADRLEAGYIRMRALEAEKGRLRGMARQRRSLYQAHRDYMRYSSIEDKLKGEHGLRFEKAKEVIKKHGQDPTEIGQERERLLEAAMQNRTERYALRGQLRMLEGILDSGREIRERISEMEGNEIWKEKRQDLSSREQRLR